MSSDARRFTFLQISDAHLDSIALATGFPLTIAQRAAREKELLQVVVDALRAAKERQVDIVMLVGDLWHNETVRGATVQSVIESCAELGEIPVLIAPGNRDYFSASSFYNNEALELRGLPAWPENVFIFDSPEFKSLQHPFRSNITFTGRAFISPETISERLLSMPIEREDSEISILLYHGALEAYSGNDADRENKMTAPFSTAELKSQNFTYAALGHYHDYTEVRLDSGLLLGAYSGCPSGRSFYETGPRCVLFGAIEPGRPGRWNLQLEPVELDKRRLIMVASDITGLAKDDMQEEIVANIEEQGGRAVTDIVFLHMEGRYGADNDPQLMLAELRQRFPELVVYDNTRPDFLAESYEQNSAESKFIEALLELKRRIERARSSGESDTGLSGKVVEDALYYGLDALKNKRITLRNVD
jgi:DNA repair exonuclease SbcCD nuclease subunit